MYLACKDPRVPWYAKVVVACVVGYALSPIDLVPDFIPILGYLHDLVLVPAGIGLALRLIPKEVMTECRERALEAMGKGKPRNWVAAGVIITEWVLALALTVAAIARFIRR